MDKVYRQGDVLLKPVDNIPATAKKQGSLLLRKGEHGGLHSLFDETKEAQVLVQTRPGRNGRAAVKTKFVDAPNGAKIVHGEHGPVEVPAGKYELVVQREIEAGRTRSVAD